MCSACLTTRNSKAIDEYRSSINEFDRTLPETGNFRVDTGTMSVVNGVALLQFEQVLLGERRYLNIESSAQGMRFYESAEKVVSAKKVFLIRQLACCMDDQAFREILFLNPGQTITPAEIMKKHFHANIGAPEFPASILVMDFSNIYTFSAMQAFWEKAGEVSYLVQAPGTDYNEVMKDIRWQERSRLKLTGLYAWYGVTVPVDIVTSPFQLAGLLLLGKGAQ